MMMYPFFYRPHSMKLEQGWHLYLPHHYYQQVVAEVSRDRQRGQRVGGDCNAPEAMEEGRDQSPACTTHMAGQGSLGHSRPVPSPLAQSREADIAPEWRWATPGGLG